MPQFKPGDRVVFRDGMTVLGEKDIFTVRDVETVYDGNGNISYVAYRFFETPFTAYENWLEVAK